MINLTPEQIAEYFHRSYTAVDGLWFVKVEEREDFETALDLDEGVWEIMPKIQARKLKQLTGLTEGLDALCECLSTKLAIEGFEFTVEKATDGRSFDLILSNCPWHELLKKAGREHLSEPIGNRICQVEYAAWAAEFGADILYQRRNGLCRGSATCTLRFAT